MHITASEKTLIEAAAGGCRTSFEKLMRSHGRVMRAAVSSGAKGLAVDRKALLAEASSLTWKLREALTRKAEAIDAWLWSISVSCLIRARKRCVAEELEESRLIDAALAGDGKAFNELLRLHTKVMTEAAQRYVRGTTNLLEDVLADAKVRAFRSLGKFKRNCRIGTWLFRLTMNVALDSLKLHTKRKAEVELDEDHDGADEGAELQAEQRLLLGRAWEVLEGLEELPRALFTANVFEGQNFSELAKTHRMPRERVSEVVSQVMAQMRALTADE